MNEEFLDGYDVEINPAEAVFVISVVSELVGIPVWTLRKLDEMDVVKPRRMGKKTRCYSKIQIKKLNYVYYLMQERKVNISGVKVILEKAVGQGELDDGAY